MYLQGGTDICDFYKGCSKGSRCRGRSDSQRRLVSSFKGTDKRL